MRAYAPLCWLTPFQRLHHDGAPVYVYSFDYAVNAVTATRAFHGIDTTILFGNNFGAPSNHVLDSADLVIYDTMSTYWRQFMERGDPNPRAAPIQWPPYRPLGVDGYRRSIELGSLHRVW